MAAMFNVGGQNVESSVAYYQPKGNKMSANELIPNHFRTSIVKYMKIYSNILISPFIVKLVYLMSLQKFCSAQVKNETNTEWQNN
jgi:hypothetical protein